MIRTLHTPLTAPARREAIERATGIAALALAALPVVAMLSAAFLALANVAGQTAGLANGAPLSGSVEVASAAR